MYMYFQGQQWWMVNVKIRLDFELINYGDMVIWLQEIDKPQLYRAILPR